MAVAAGSALHLRVLAGSLDSSASYAAEAKPSPSQHHSLRQTRHRANERSVSGLSSHDSLSASSLSRNCSWSKCAGGESTSRRHGSAVVRAMSGSKATDAIPTLNDLPLYPFINNQGRIVPPIEAKTEASVFAVFDSNKKIQYIGFSKDIRNSLRTLMGRRPEFCYFYKLHNMDGFDQQVMLDTRKQWFSELGLPPVGNSEPAQRAMWEKPAESGSISERGRAAAATSKARTLIQMMQDRGLKEEMVYDPALIEEGKCDVLPSKGQSEEEIAQQAEANAAYASRMRHVSLTAPSGEPVEFDINFQSKIQTNGGWMFDILVTKEDKDTRHRVICGRFYPESVNLKEEDFVERVFAFLLHKKVPRRTEGVLTSDQFAVNYFAVSEVAQKFPDFKEWFSQELPDSYWRFNRIHTYGAENSPLSETKLYTPQY